MRQMYYRLNEKHEPIPCTLYETDWSDPPRRVGNTRLPWAWVSTVFLPLNHAWDDGPPVLFETMIFGGAFDQEQWRYRTWAEAEVGHRRAVALALFGRVVWLWRELSRWWKGL